MRYSFPTQQISYIIDSTVISRNRNYPLWDLEDVLLPLFEKNYTYDSLRETIRSANHIWCAYEYGTCIGCSLITDIGNNRGLYMMLFGIRKSAQGQGVGKRLLENIIRWSTRQGYTYIYLHTELDNKKAIRMYERAGFRREFYLPDVIEQLPQMGSDAMPMVLYLN
jgi:ribosomal protein S18 acetylase RimI-like enzyme